MSPRRVVVYAGPSISADGCRIAFNGVPSDFPKWENPYPDPWNPVDGVVLVRNICDSSHNILPTSSWTTNTRVETY